jgi:hypothetical protein
VDLLPNWDSLESQDVDIVVHVRGLTPYVPKPGQVNVLWIISHPDDVSDDECERFDLVLVASEIHAEELALRVSVPVAPLLQASEFATAQETGGSFSDALLFVGNSRGVNRKVVDWSVERELPIQVVGSGWEPLLNSRYLYGTHIANEDLPDAYGSAAIVLNDHWPDMAARGFISNRVFDVLAAGGFLLSDAVIGLDQVFGDAVPTYESADDLERLVRLYLSDPDERRRLADQGQEMIRSAHSFDHRAEEFDTLVRPLFASRIGLLG